MSLVSSYVVMEDGLFYQNPVIYDDSGDWFICFDDDDPPELVIKKEILKDSSKRKGKKDILEFLENLNIPAKIVSTSSTGKRNFDHLKDLKGTSFKNAIAVYLSFTKRIPISRFNHKEDSVGFNSGKSECVVYDPEYNRDNYDIR